MNKRFIFSLALLGSTAFADLNGGPSKPVSAAQIKPETLATVKKVKPVTLNKGGNAIVTLEVEVAKNFHVQANPASQPNLIPTTLTMESLPGIKVGTPEYPKGESYKLAGTPTEVMAYGGTFKIKFSLEAEPTASSGKLTLNGKLRYQACNEKTCFFPVNAAVSIPVTVK